MDKIIKPWIKAMAGVPSMEKAKKSGFFGKLFGKNKSKCCSIEFEEVSETNPKEKISEKKPEQKMKKSPCCGCGC